MKFLSVAAIFALAYACSSLSVHTNHKSNDLNHKR